MEGFPSVTPNPEVTYLKPLYDCKSGIVSCFRTRLFFVPRKNFMSPDPFSGNFVPISPSVLPNLHLN